jgi:hypothetical protein
MLLGDLGSAERNLELGDTLTRTFQKMECAFDVPEGTGGGDDIRFCLEDSLE